MPCNVSEKIKFINCINLSLRKLKLIKEIFNIKDMYEY